jgi:hypothetical protein
VVRTIFPLLLPLFLTACHEGDNTAMQAFYATVKPGIPLAEAVRNAEETSANLSVAGKDCPGASVEVSRERYSGVPRIRVTQPQPSNPSSRGYSEAGYATREEFARALTEQLPAFYTCKTFRFRFLRAGVWTQSDSFWVSVDAQGLITAVSELRKDW